MDNELVINASNLILSIICANTPVDTRNLLNNTTMKIYGNKTIIEITAPKVTNKGNDDYAQYVNYRPNFKSGKPNPNYHYVERAILQACNIIASRIGAEIVNEL